MSLTFGKWVVSESFAFGIIWLIFVDCVFRIEQQSLKGMEKFYSKGILNLKYKYQNLDEIEILLAK